MIKSLKIKVNGECISTKLDFDWTDIDDVLLLPSYYCFTQSPGAAVEGREINLIG